MTRLNAADASLFAARVPLGGPADASPEAKAAQDFEAILIRQMLTSVRRGLAAMGGEKASFGGSMAREMLDEQLAQTLAEAGGMGLQKELMGEMQDLGPSETAGPVDKAREVRKGTPDDDR